MTRRIIIDTDPGKDDAAAILLALAHSELEVVALTPVHGNVPLALTERNARALLCLAGRSEIPVHPGCARPMVGSPIHAVHVHGETGLGSLLLADPAVPAQLEDGVAYLIRTLRAEPAGTLTICVLGPVTNLAVALVQAPDIAARIAEVVMMGGAIDGGGNVTASAEFNVYADPEAARVLLASGARITLVPLDLTHRVRLTAAVMGRLRQIGTQSARAIVDLFGPDQDPPMHDPCVIAYLLRPDLFRAERHSVAVELTGELTRGMTVADRRRGRSAANASVLLSGDAAGFFELFLAALTRLP